MNRLNPLQIGNTTGPYGYSKHTKNKPIITNIKELKNEGEMSSDEEQI
jgi:hypothetical protein